MKIALPHGWFARTLLGAWALFLIGMLLFFLTAFLPHSHLVGYLIKPLWILSIFAVLGIFAYAAAYTIGRLHYYWTRAWHGEALGFAIGPIERILVAGWLLFIVAALGALLFSQEKWFLAFGPEVVWSLFCVVGFSSIAYGSYLLLRQVMKGLRRGQL